MVVCYLLNGLDSSVYNVNVSECRLYNEDGVVASARIGILATGEIKPNSYKECKFRLPANTIYVEDVNLRKIEMDCTFKYSVE